MFLVHYSWPPSRLLSAPCGFPASFASAWYLFYIQKQRSHWLFFKYRRYTPTQMMKHEGMRIQYHQGDRISRIMHQGLKAPCISTNRSPNINSINAWSILSVVLPVILQGTLTLSVDVTTKKISAPKLSRISSLSLTSWRTPHPNYAYPYNISIRYECPCLKSRH